MLKLFKRWRSAVSEKALQHYKRALTHDFVPSAAQHINRGYALLAHNRKAYGDNAKEEFMQAFQHPTCEKNYARYETALSNGLWMANFPDKHHTFHYFENDVIEHVFQDDALGMK